MRIIKEDNKIKMIKLRLNKPKMTQQFILIVVVILCLNSDSPRAFVSAGEEDGGFETTTTEFGENLKIIYFNLVYATPRSLNDMSMMFNILWSKFAD